MADKRTEWQDFFVDRVLHAEDIVRVLSTYLMVEPSSVVVVENLEQVSDCGLPPQRSIICERLVRQQEFPMLIFPYPQTEEVKARDGFQFIEFLCATEGCRCLTGDESPNPYCWLLVEGFNRCKRVFVNMGWLDDKAYGPAIDRDDPLEGLSSETA